MTSQEINNLLNELMATWIGRKADYPPGQYIGECLSLVKLWVDKVAGRKVAPPAGGWGNYYYTRFPAPLGNYFEKKIYVSGASYSKGSLVTYDATHHIAILLSNGPTKHEVFEQNADPDHSPSHRSYRPNSYATGILVIKAQGGDMITNREDNRQLFLDICFRNPLPQEVDRYVGWELQRAREDLRRNASRRDLDIMAKAYYDNGAKIPEQFTAQDLGPGVYKVN